MGILIAYLLGILTASKPKNHNGDCEHRSTDCHENQPFPRGPFSVISLPRTLSVEEQAEKEKKEGRKTISFWVRIASLGVLVVYAGVTILIWCANKKAADAAMIAAMAAKTASETAQKQLEQTERPWLKVSFSVQPPGITFQDGGMQLNIVPRIENIGHSVATGVVSPMKIFLADDEESLFNAPLKRQKEFCDKLASQPVSHRQETSEVAIFPSDSDSSWGYGLGLSKAEVDAAKDRGPASGTKATGPKLLIPIVYGCVDYVYGTSERHHQTRFILELQQVNRTQTVPARIPTIAIRAGQPVDAVNVVITKYPFGGFNAY